MSVLTATNISVLFGGLKAVEDFSIDIEQGELLGLIGPNGAGKTTVFNLLTGVYQPTTGSILLNGKDITGKKPAQIVGVGAARTFQNIRLFKEMSVIENVQVADNVNRTYGIAAALLRTKKYWAEEKASREKAMELLRVFDMETLADSPAKNLPYGKQRKLEIARALATNPTLLLLDEPAAGMNPTETTELMETIALIREKFKVAILLIEHDMSLV
ncbi:MAG: ABC transporter ATP-binding protein, partial [Pygmaiobacter sp.]